MGKVTAKEMAAMLNGREYGKEISKEEEQLAKINNLLVCFGASDDLLEFHGVYREGVGAWDGHTVRFRLDKMRVVECDDCKDCLARTKVITITAEWCPKDLNCSWNVYSDVEYETFDIIEDRELFCRGCVIDLEKCK